MHIAFPDCVMVALQILVLTVGVRILLGELKGDCPKVLEDGFWLLDSPFFMPAVKLVPSSIGLGREILNL